MNLLANLLNYFLKKEENIINDVFLLVKSCYICQK